MHTYSFIFFPLFSETFPDENWIVLNVIYEKFDPYKEKVDVRADLYKFWSKSYISEKQDKQTNKHIKTLKKTEKEMKTNLPTTICNVFFVDYSNFLHVQYMQRK